MSKSVKDVFIKTLRDWLFTGSLIIAAFLTIAILFGAITLVAGGFFLLFKHLSIPLWGKIILAAITAISIFLFLCYSEAKEEFRKRRDRK